MGGFYDDSPEEILRFGDVITGFKFATPGTHDPSTEMHNDWAIAVSSPAYAAVMTPCCSIEKKAFALAPLVEIRPGFLDNDYLAEDLTRVNGKVAPEHCVPRAVWEKWPFEQRQLNIAKGHSYIFIDCFIYEAHDLLRKYTLKRKERKGGPVEVGHYMVDFKSICRVDCNLVDRGKPAPPGTKILQLAVSRRQVLREKLSFYYARVPDEDARYVSP